jgi:hypothetical protein
MKEASPVSQEELLTFLLDPRSYSPHPKPSLFRLYSDPFFLRSARDRLKTLVAQHSKILFIL